MKQVFLFLGIIIQTSALWGAYYDPAYTWRTISSEHFELHYPDFLQAVAKDIPAIAERVHAELTTLMQYNPRGKTHLILSDHTDLANGSAQVFPRRIIRLFATHPVGLNELIDYRERFASLLSHEYMHVLMMETTGGLPWLFNTIFGPWWLPNTIAPTWMLEGYAVYAESRAGRLGRLNSALMRGYLNGLAINGSLPSIDQISNNWHHWPFGTTAYLFGGLIIQHISHQVGEKWMPAYTKRYGTAWIPYGINLTMKAVHGLDLREIYRDVMFSLTREAKLRALSIELQNNVSRQQLTHHGYKTGAPRIANNHLYYVKFDTKSQPMLMDFNLQLDQEESLLTLLGSPQFDLHPSGRFVIISQVDYYRRYHQYRDLYKFDITTHTMQRLSWGLRAQQPAIHPNGKKLAYIVNQYGHSMLWLAPIDQPQQGEIIVAFTDGSVISEPVFHPSGKYIATVIKRNNGNRYVHIFQIDPGVEQVQAIYTGSNTIGGLRYSQDGKQLFFHGDATQIYNIYQLDVQSGFIGQMTNEVAGGFYPFPYGENLFYLMLGEHGYNIVLSSLRSRISGLTSCIAKSPSNYQAAIACQISDEPFEYTSQIPMITEERFVEKPYAAWKTLLPTVWMPLLTEDVKGTILGIATQGRDVVGKHVYTLQVGYGTESRHPYVTLSYAPQLFRLDTSFRFMHTLGYGPDSYINDRVDGPIAERITYGSVILSYPWVWWNKSIKLSLSYAMTYRSFTEDVTDNLQPIDGRFAYLSLGASFSNALSFVDSLGPSQGRTISVSATFEDPTVGSQWESLSVIARYKEYLGMPWSPSGCLALHIETGWAQSNYEERNYFVFGSPPRRDIVLDSLFQHISGGTYIRGLDRYSIGGNGYGLAKLEYRQLLWNCDRGIGTLPFYIRRIHAAVFTDAIQIAHYDQEFTFDDWGVGSGAELRADITIGYYFYPTLRIGYAHGWGSHGGHQFYLLLGTMF